MGRIIQQCSLFVRPLQAHKSTMKPLGTSDFLEIFSLVRITNTAVSQQRSKFKVVWVSWNF